MIWTFMIEKNDYYHITLRHLTFVKISIHDFIRIQICVKICQLWLSGKVGKKKKVMVRIPSGSFYYFLTFLCVCARIYVRA